MTLPGLQNPPQIAMQGDETLNQTFLFFLCLCKVHLPVTPVPCIQIGRTHCLLSDRGVQSAINYPAVNRPESSLMLPRGFMSCGGRVRGQAGWDTMSSDEI